MSGRAPAPAGGGGGAGAAAAAKPAAADGKPPWADWQENYAKQNFYAGQDYFFF